MMADGAYYHITHVNFTNYAGSELREAMLRIRWPRIITPSSLRCWLDFLVH